MVALGSQLTAMTMGDLLLDYWCPEKMPYWGRSAAGTLIDDRGALNFFRSIWRANEVYFAMFIARLVLKIDK